jgi:hypothetical protein
VWFYPIDHEATLGYLAAINTLVKSLAWPATTLVVIWFFRSAIAKLADRIEQLDGGGTSIKFTRVLEEVATTVDRIDADSNAPPVDQPSAAVLPRQAVLDAWIALEQDLKTLYETAYRENPRGPTMQLALRLRKTQTIDGDTYIALKRLADLRNAAAHAVNFSVSETSVQEYQELTNRIRAVLQDIRNSLKP